MKRVELGEEEKNRPMNIQETTTRRRRKSNPINRRREIQRQTADKTKPNKTKRYSMQIHFDWPLSPFSVLNTFHSSMIVFVFLCVSFNFNDNFDTSDFRWSSESLMTFLHSMNQSFDRENSCNFHWQCQRMDRSVVDAMLLLFHL